MEIKALADRYESYILDRRHEYHAHPELSNMEKETRQRLKQDLLDLGITDIRELETCYGLTATIHGGKPGKTVALRTDTDALPVTEETGLPFASQNQGVMHACGHDNHMAMLLGAARILNDVKDELCGDVRLLIQPAEEVAAGAKALMQEGALDGVDAIYGAHIWGNVDAPLMDVSAGNRMACCHSFTIQVEGVSSHASAPHVGVDAIMVACSIAQNLQQVVSRMNDPLNPLVLTIGTIHGGNRWNVLAGHATMEGTVRTFTEDTVVEDRMRSIIESTAASFGAKATLEYEYLVPPVINDDEQLNRIASAAVEKLYGPEALGHLPPMMGSEDFAEYRVGGTPSIFGILGSRNPAKGKIYSNHHEKYDVDEDVLKRGAAIMAQFAADYLNETAQK